MDVPSSRPLGRSRAGAAPGPVASSPRPYREGVPHVPPPPRPSSRPRRPAGPPHGRGSAPAAPRGRGRPRWARRIVTTLSVSVLAAAGIGHTLMTGIDSGIERVDPFKDMKNRPRAGNGTTMLLVGTDGRDRITPAERAKYRLGGEPCRCTDTIMIVHISADRGRASVVSLPRDSYAEIPGHADRTTGRKHAPHPVKLNAAYAEGGPQLTVRTVEHMTGVKIDHYLEVDFTSFMRTVDVVGGVRICTEKPMKDAYTGLDLAAGPHDLNGGQALQYVRSRHIDGAADLGRMQRQQTFMAALIAKATSSGVLLNPVRFRELAQTSLGSVRASRDFGTDEMLALGRAMKGFSPSSSEFTTVPVGNPSHQVKGLGSTVKWDDRKAKRLFQALRDDKPLTVRKKRPAAVEVPVAPDQIRVQVENGTAAAGLGGKVDAALRGTGFRTTGVPMNAADRTVTRTLIFHDPRWDRSAKSLAAALPGSELREQRGRGPVMRVVAGSGYEGVTRVRAAVPAESGEFGAVSGDEVLCGG
ncbi:LCP family protein [Streptomyces uncialis]|uniref:LCP family protein n=1 Tax=Streptomyces uncialis TaxID=1048205 RepID=UPI0009A11473